MTTDPQLFWFGCVLTLGCICLVLSWLSSDTSTHSQSEIKQGETKTVELQQKNLELQQQCLRLREELQQQKTQLNRDFRHATFDQLKTLLTNYPSARQIAQSKPDLPARNLVSLFTPLENLLQTWGIEAIGSVWEQVPYNPQLHQPDTDDIAIGEMVYIRFVGYRQGDEILCSAKVSRTLPGGAQSGEAT